MTLLLEAIRGDIYSKYPVTKEIRSDKEFKLYCSPSLYSSLQKDVEANAWGSFIVDRREHKEVPNQITRLVLPYIGAIEVVVSPKLTGYFVIEKDEPNDRDI